jgi:hypothetical protein
MPQVFNRSHVLVEETDEYSERRLGEVFRSLQRDWTINQGRSFDRTDVHVRLKPTDGLQTSGGH